MLALGSVIVAQAATHLSSDVPFAGGGNPYSSTDIVTYDAGFDPTPAVAGLVPVGTGISSVALHGYLVYFTVDAPVDLTDVTVHERHIVTYDPRSGSYATAVDLSPLLPPGVAVDALHVTAPNRFVFSISVPAAIDGTPFTDSDLIALDQGHTSLLIPEESLAVPPAANIDALSISPLEDTVYFSVDAPTNITNIAVDSADIVARDAAGWNLAFEANAAGMPPGVDVHGYQSEMDTDGDGLADWWELLYYGNLSPTPGGNDDSDALSNLGEYERRGNPKAPDTDGDGMLDGWEAQYDLLLDVDDALQNPDADTAVNGREHAANTNPRLAGDQPNPGILFVDGAAQDTGDGSSWNSPFTSLQRALDSSIDADQLWIRQGTYVPPGAGPAQRAATFLVARDVHLFGGFAGHEVNLPDRDIDANLTLLSGDPLRNDGADVRVDEQTRQDNCYHVVTVPPGAMPTFDGITIGEGNANGPAPDDLGGGVFIGAGAAPTFRRSTLASNSARFGGGAFSMSESAPTFISSTVADNTAEFDGGGLAFDQTMAALWNTRIVRNMALGSGGGIAADMGTTDLINCVLQANSAGNDGGGMFYDSPDPQSRLTNCTFNGNQAGTAGGAISSQGQSNILVRNSILWGDAPDELAGIGSAYVSYSDIDQNGYAGIGGNIRQDPRFNDLNEGDLGLRPDSPAIDAAASATVPQDVVDLDEDTNTNELVPLDIANSSRLVDIPAVPDTGTGSPVVDMGAFEAGRIIYVDETIAAGNGASWDAALPHLQDALNVAQPDDEVWVAQGHYTPTVDPTGDPTPADLRTRTFTLRSGVRVYGGFQGGETGRADRRPELYHTVLSGDLGVAGNHADNAYHVVYGADVVNSVLDGFVVSDGNADGPPSGQRNGTPSNRAGAGIYCANMDSSNRIANNMVMDNAALETGGGIFAVNCSFTFDDCTLSHNTAVQGAGIYTSGGAPGLFDCTVTANAATLGGGLFLDIWGTSGEVDSCEISGNTAAEDGAGLFLSMGMGRVVNSIVSGNAAAADGGGFFAGSGELRIVNCTVAGNHAEGAGGGVFCASGANPGITNTIFAENTHTAVVEDDLGADPTLTNCLFYDNPEGDVYDADTTSVRSDAAQINALPEADANTDQDPAFVPRPAGAWTAVVYEPGTNTTTLTHTGANVTPAALTELLIVANRNEHRQDMIHGNDTDSIDVRGNLTGRVAPGDPYRIVDYRLTDSSGAVDTGTAVDAPSIDIEELSRPVDIPGRGADGTGAEIDIGAYELAAAGPVTGIGNLVWYDINFDGAQDPSEVGVANVTVNLLNSSGQPLPGRTTVTDGAGRYSFESLDPSPYIVEFVLPLGHVFSAANAATDDQDSDADPISGRTEVINVAQDQYIENVDAGILGNLDTDGDSMTDLWEVVRGLNPLNRDANDHMDTDNVPNDQEFYGDTNPYDPASVPFFRPGAGTALGFNGVSDYVDCGYNPGVTGMPELVLEAWVRPDVVDAENRVIISNLGVNDQTTGGYQLSITPAGRFNLNYRALDHIDRPLSSTTVIAANRWYHVAGRLAWDGAGMQADLFVNGILDASTYWPGIGEMISYNNVSNLFIGSNIDGLPQGGLDVTREFFGVMDEVRIWNIALPDQVIRNWMNTRINHYHPFFHRRGAHWSFEEGIGAAAACRASASNIGLLAHPNPDGSWLVSQAPVGDESHREQGATPLVAANSTVPIDIAWDVPPDPVGVCAAIQVQQAPANTAGLLDSNADTYWEIWVSHGHGAFQADVSVRFDDIDGIGNENALRLYTRTGAGTPWSELAAYQVDVEGNAADGRGVVTFDDATAFSQFILTSSDPQNPLVELTGPTLTQWQLIDDTGASPSDYITRDPDLELLFTFDEPVLGSPTDIIVEEGPGMNPVPVTAATGWDTTQVNATLATLPVDGTYTVTLQASHTIRDREGNALNGGNDVQLFFTLDTTPPDPTAVSIGCSNPNLNIAGPGDTVTLLMTLPEPVYTTPVVTIDGRPAHQVTPLDSTTWEAVRVMQPGDTPGPVSFAIDAVDPAGNVAARVTQTDDGSVVFFDETPPTLVDWRVEPDTGVNAQDGLTASPDPDLVLIFDEPVLGTPDDIDIRDAFGQPVTPTYVDGFDTTRLTATLQTLPLDGEYSVVLRGTATITDRAGNPLNGGTDIPLSFTLDTAAPTVTDWELLPDTGTDPNDRVTREDLVQLMFTFSEPVLGTNTDVYADGPFAAPVPVTYLSAWNSSTLTVGLARLLDPGPHTVWLEGAQTITDRAGNPLNDGAGEMAPFEFDPLPPGPQQVTITSSNPYPGVARDGDQVTVTVVFDEPIDPSSVAVQIAGEPADSVQELPGAGTAPSYVATRNMLPTDPQGTISFHINATDVAGNPAAPVTQADAANQVVFDRTPPLLSHWEVDSDTGASPTDHLTADVNPTLHFAFDEPVLGTPADIEITDPSGQVLILTPTFVQGFDTSLVSVYLPALQHEGIYSILLRAASTITDRAGNPLNGGTDIPLSFTLDTTPPTLTSWELIPDTGIDPHDRVTKAPDIDLSFTFSEPVLGTNTDVQAFNPLAAPVPVSFLTAWNASPVTVRLAPLTVDGNHTIELLDGIEDAAGNGLNGGNSEMLDVLFDSTPPPFSSVSMYSSNSLDPLLARVGDTVEILFSILESEIPTPVVTIAGSAADSVTHLGGGSWYATRQVQPPDPAGPVSFTIDAVDRAGNSAPTVTSVTYGETVVIGSLDFGDAPDDPQTGFNYPTLAASDGARHILRPGLYLGTEIDAEDDGLPGPSALGDDAGGPGPDDEDGVHFPAPLVVGETGAAEITTSLPPGTQATISAWIDFNRDGDWNDSHEQILYDRAVDTTPTMTVTFSVPYSATPTNATFARFRLSTASGLLPDGPAPDGEVEDYLVEILPRPTISGLKYEDVDADGAYDPLVDQPLADCVVYVDTNLNGVYDPVEEPSATTDANGLYTITGAPTGTSVVREDIPRRFRQTFPRSIVTGAVGVYDFLDSNGANAYDGPGALPDMTSVNVDFDARSAWFDQLDDYLELPQPHGTQPFTIWLNTTLADPATPQQPPQTPYTNPIDAADVNADGVVSPIDSLILINTINQHGAGAIPAGTPAPPYIDVNGDEQITALDVLIVINTLNQQAGTRSQPPSFIVSQGTGVTPAELDFTVEQDPTSHELLFSYFNAAGDAAMVSNGINDGQRHQFAITWDPALGALGGFFDYQCQTDSVAGALPDIEPGVTGVRIGARAADNSAGFIGAVHQVRVFPTVLGEFQLVALGGGHRVVAEPGENITDVDFGNTVPGSIHGLKFNDLDANGVWDGQEPGLAGVQVTLSGRDGLGRPVHRTVTTDASGEYAFTWVPPGEYTVTETVPPGSVATTPSSCQVTLSSREEVVAEQGQAQITDPNDPRFEVLVGPDLIFGNAITYDFGDAPDPTYLTAFHSNGARHAASATGPVLGETVDYEPAAVPTPAADGDDVNGDDEDGVTFAATRLVAGQNAQVNVTVSQSAGKLDAWIDFNRDGTWQHPAEHIFGGVSRNVALGPQALQFAVPYPAAAGPTFARFRISAEGALLPSGLAADGEVEDHPVAINHPPQPAPDTYPAAEDTTLIVALPGVLANDTDPDDVTLSAHVVTDPGHGALTLGTDGAVSYLPNPEFSGQDSFTYRANDGFQDSSPTTVVINVAPLNDPPVVTLNTGISVLQGRIASIGAGHLAGADVDSPPAQLLVVLDSPPAAGQLRLDGTPMNPGESMPLSDLSTGRLAYAHNGIASTPDSFEFSLSDDEGGVTGPHTFNITVQPDDVAPTVTAVTLADNTGVSQADGITADTTPVLTVTFSEPVLGTDTDVKVQDPSGQAVIPDSVTGWGAGPLVIEFTTPLTAQGEYTVALEGTTTITDLAHNPLNGGTDELIHFELDTLAPAVLTVSAPNGRYGVGATLDVAVKFSEAVHEDQVRTAPALLLDTGTPPAQALYHSGLGTDTLMFRYTVQAGDTNPDLDVVDSQSLLLNAVSLVDEAGNSADPTLPAPGTGGSLSATSDVNIDTSTGYAGITDLGNLGAPYVRPMALNSPNARSAAPQIVGFARNAGDGTQAFIWNDGAMQALNPGGDWAAAYAINNTGTVTGHRGDDDTGTVTAFLGQPGATLDLPTLGGNTSVAYGINSAGDAVGASAAVDGNLHACRWGAAATDLGTLGGDASIANAINDSGAVVGTAQDGSGRWQAFLWTAARRGMIDIDDQDSDGSVAQSINSAGVVVGYRHTDSDETQPFVWTQTGGVTDLPGLGGKRAVANGINDAGTIVGWAETSQGERHAVLWKDGGLLDLNHLVLPGDNWLLSGAAAINNDGHVIGHGEHQGQSAAFLLQSLQDNIQPHAEIAEPASNHTAPVGSTVTITANAVDFDGQIAEVRFFIDQTLVRTDTQHPFEHLWQNVPLGNHDLHVEATDDEGAISASPVTVVHVVTNVPPVAADDTGYSVPQYGQIVVPPTGVLANDTGGNTRVLRAILEQGPLHGTVVLNEDGAFVYTTDTGHVGQDTFTYRAADELEVSAPATVTITVTQRQLTFDLELKTGWNLVSIPITPDDPNIAAVLQGSQTGPVWHWDGTGYVEAAQILPKQGYWVYRDGPDTTVTINGTPVVDTTVAVTPDWALIGPVALQPYQPVAPDWMADPDGRVTPPAHGWTDNAYSGEAELRCGKGYWLRIRQATTLDVGSH